MANSSNISDSEVKFMPWFWWLRGTIAVITVLGNLLVMLLILTRSSLRTTHNSFVLSLAVADFLVGLYFPLEFVLKFLNNDFNNHFLNAVVNFVVDASMTNLCALTLDHYLSIIHPLKHCFFKRKRNVVTTLAIAWSSAFLAAFVDLLFHLFVTNSKMFMRCFHIFLLIFFEAFPCISLPLAYFRIAYVARRQQAQMKKQANQLQHNYIINRETKRCKKNNRMIRVLGGIIVFFGISYIVNVYRTCLKYVQTSPETNPTLNKVTYSLLYINSAINVFCYGLFKKDFRIEMAKLFCKRVARGRKQARSSAPAAKRTTEL